MFCSSIWIAGIPIYFVILLVFTLGIKIVPANYVYIIERLGVYKATWEPGIHFLLIGAEKIYKKIPLNEQKLIFNVTFKDYFSNNMNIELETYYQITNPHNFAYHDKIVLEDLQDYIKEKISEIIFENEFTKNDIQLQKSNIIQKIIDYFNETNITDLKINKIKIII